MAAFFTVDLESDYHAVVDPCRWGQYDDLSSIIQTYNILRVLKMRSIIARFYVLGHIAENHPGIIQAIRADGHQIGSHGYYHGHREHEGDPSDKKARQYIGNCYAYRSPYWDSTKRPGFATGAYFRILPYGIVRSSLEYSGVLAIHPHDLEPEPRKLSDAPWWRTVNVKQGWDRLYRLLDDVKFKSFQKANNV